MSIGSELYQGMKKDGEDGSITSGRITQGMSSNLHFLLTAVRWPFVYFWLCWFFIVTCSFSCGE